MIGKLFVSNRIMLKPKLDVYSYFVVVSRIKYRHDIGFYYKILYKRRILEIDKLSLDIKCEQIG